MSDFLHTPRLCDPVWLRSMACVLSDGTASTGGASHSSFTGRAMFQGGNRGGEKKASGIAGIGSKETSCWARRMSGSPETGLARWGTVDYEQAGVSSIGCPRRGQSLLVGCTRQR